MFERYYQELLRFITHKTGDRQEAAELAQEVFLRAHAFARSEGVIEQPRAFLYRAAANLMVDAHRRGRLRAHEPLGEQEYLAPETCEPEIIAASRQRVELLLGAIAELPPRCREAFILHKFEDLSHAEVAARMGVSRNMVEKHIINAMLHCRRKLDEVDG